MWIIVIHTNIGDVYYSGFGFDDWSENRSDAKKYYDYDEAKTYADRIGAGVERY